MMKDKNYDELAKHEIGWWKAHHRRDKKLLTEHMAKLYSIQFGISYESAVDAVKYRVDATKEHNLAEKLEDEGKQVQADVHWNNAEKLLREHFKVLYSKTIN